MLQKTSNILCLDKVDQDIEYFFGLQPTFVFVKDLTFYGIQLIKQAEEKRIKIYSAKARRKTAKERWLRHTIIGNTTPTVYGIELSNGVNFYDYNNFDSKAAQATVEDMYELANELVNNFTYVNQSGRTKLPMTCASILKQKLPLIKTCQGEYGRGITNATLIDYSRNAAFGGAIALMPNFYDCYVKYETHIDFHQIYSYVLMNENFPNINTEPIVEPGFQPHQFAIYSIQGGRAKLKKNGFALLSSKNAKNKGGETDKTIQCDHRWFNITDYFDCLTSVDYITFLENYDIENLVIGETLWYQRSFNGVDIFGGLIKDLYNKRQTTNGAVKRFYKLINENIPGSFERSMVNTNGFWSDLTNTIKQPKFVHYNCIIGDFITAYARRKLSALLHEFKFEDIIGYDTDAVFFKGLPTEVPEIVLKQFGDEPGQLHFDGIFHNVYHFAPKQYIGCDENNEIFGKLCGIPNGDEVAKLLFTKPLEVLTIEGKVWNKETKSHDIAAVPIKLNIKPFLRTSGFLKELRQVIKYEESR